jgi:hypothetical protein
MSPRTLVFRGKDRRCANGLKKALTQTALHRRGGPGYTPYLLLRYLMKSNITGTTPAIDVSIARQADRAAGYWRSKSVATTQRSDPARQAVRAAGG